MKPTTIAEYRSWARDHIPFDVTDVQLEKRYNNNTLLIRTSIENSAVWGAIQSNLAEWNNEYKTNHSVPLFNDANPDIRLLIKPFQSVIEKTYRSNVLFNKRFPNPPRLPLPSDIEAWITEHNLYESLNDIVRCRIICRYMDGPEYLCGKIQTTAANAGLTAKYYSMETDLGYYSWHVSIPISAQLVRANGAVDDVTVSFEIQITTHLQDVLNDLTHRFYEDRRTSVGNIDKIWKWRPDQPKFRGAYFGHTLHLLEGLLVELKNSMNKGPTQ
jgi:ppGpp synthetase/RelA/SpoT-type nucleotidyltranferase